MPIYLVRWPGWVASLVRADDEGALQLILDEEASTEGAEWTLYEGPIAIDFRLNAGIEFPEPVKGARRRARIGDVSELRDRPFVLALPGIESAGEMTQAIMETAFPAIASVLAEAQGDKELDAEKVTEAITTELYAFLAPVPDPEPIPYPVADPTNRREPPRAKLIPFKPRPRS